MDEIHTVAQEKMLEKCWQDYYDYALKKRLLAYSFTGSAPLEACTLAEAEEILNNMSKAGKLSSAKTNASATFRLFPPPSTTPTGSAPEGPTHQPTKSKSKC